MTTGDLRGGEPLADAVHALLREHRERIIREWKELLAREARGGEAAGGAMREGAAAYLTDLADWLESGAPPRAPRLAAEARERVVRRVDDGADLAAVLDEVRLLREALLRVVLEAAAAAPRDAAAAAAFADELLRLNAGFDVALSDSFVQLVTEREARAAAERARLESDRRRGDEALRDREAELRAVLEQLPIAVAVLGMDGRVVTGNSALAAFEITRPPSQDPEQRTRWSGGDASGQPLAPDRWPGARALRGDTVSPGIPFVYRRAGRPDVHTVVSAVPLRDPTGRQTGVIVVIQDVSTLVEAEAELRRADQQKTEFIAVLSHELRNPLAPIRNSLYLLEHADPASEQAARARQVLLRQTDHLTRLVDDLLDVTRIIHGKTELRRELLDLRDVVRRTTDDVRSVFEQSGVELRVEQGVGPVWVDGDATRLAQIVGNLLGNAVKFTPSGGSVTVRLGVDPDHATLAVTDTGAGMEPGEEHRIFEAFAQGGQGPARSRDGLGLGLALVKGLAELHGGTVRAASEGPGRGSEFVVTLPLVRPPAPSRRGPRAGTVPSRLVLIIEDNVDAGQTLAEVLALSGHRVRVAVDARSGLALGRELRPDVILCDVGLPDMSGYDFARAARSDPALARTRLVAITGYAQPQDRELARRAGFDAHLPKPPQIDAIEELLAEPPR